ncbi:major facilitator superfamily domain-containing protein [Podospora aff. communis PSN243]|uniref:Major facilitator superfamily domain-containing protein n=1 Tax=Podospora aff. communis PSN243 TaxID=3040156 RepID=A0AAV9GU32_9PEZI|nr:major facilitator superfamily domain-containing protein [Podospora aff. communis PSN243]
MGSETSSIDSKDKEKVTFDPPRRFYWAFVSLSLLALGASFSLTSLSIAVVTIAQEFNLTEPKAFWLGSSSALTSTLIQPCCACLCSIFGRKGALGFSAVCLAAGSLLAAVAQNYATLITGRCIQGIGAGGVSAITDIVITDIVPLRFRGQWFAYIGVPWAIGTTVGPIVSGVLTSGGSWRWICGINVIVCSIAIPPCLWTLPPLPREPNWQLALKSLDYAGFLLLGASLVALLVPIMQATTVHAWTALETLLPLLLGAAGLCLFLFHQGKIAKNPLVPLNRFRNRTCLLTFLCTALHGLVVWCLMFYLPLYYQAIRGFTALESGLAVLPETLTIVPASMAMGFLIGWSGRYRWAIWSGWALSAAGVALLYLLDENTPTATWICLNLPAGFGMGMLFGAMGFPIQACVDAESVPLAVSLFSFWRAFGATLGISIGSSIFASESGKIPSAHVSRGVLEGRGGLGFLAMSMKSRIFALRKIWIFCAAVCGVALLASFGIQGLSLDTPLDRQTGRISEGGDGDNAV